jgi:bis(5'-nucleosyl)-tetraphosphatase (symmetrical)
LLRGRSYHAPRLQRRIFIGDIQGCRAELELLLERIAFTRGDELHPVGDLVNRGPDSLGVLRLLKSLGAGGVLGNHDVHLLRIAAGRRALGPRDTVGDVLAAPDRDELLGWLERLPFARSWSDVLLVHAALKPEWNDPVSELAGRDPIEPDPEVEFATRARYASPRGERAKTDWPAPPPPYAPWFEHWFAAHAEDPRTVVYGHWARMGLVVRPKLRGLDSGCVWGGKLSAWIAEEDRVVQVQAARVYASYDD